MTESGTRHSIEIEFCVPCDFLAQAVAATREILEQWAYELASVTLVPSNGGRFEVNLDGELVFSKMALDRLPQAGELNTILESRLGPAPGFGA